MRSEDRCGVKGCDKESERSISMEAATKAGMDMKEGQKRAHLCKDHYKEYKKRSKVDRKIGSLGH